MGGDALWLGRCLLDSNGSLSLDGCLKVTCGLLTACTLESAPGPTLGNEYGRTLPFHLPYDITFVCLLQTVSFTATRPLNMPIESEKW